MEKGPNEVNDVETGAGIQNVIRSLSAQDLYELPIRIKSLVNRESLDKNMNHPDSVRNIFSLLIHNLKEKGFDVDQEISDLGTFLLKLNVEHLSRYRDMVTQDLPYSSHHSINHITYKIMGYGQDTFGSEYVEIYTAIVQFLENYYQLIGDYEYAEQAAESLGHEEKKKEFHKRMMDIIERGEYEKLKSFDVSTEDGRTFIRESGLIEEIDRIIELLKQTPIAQTDSAEFIENLKTRINGKVIEIQEEIEKAAK